jgi:ATP-dependent Clp protease protease subunit
MVASLVVPTVLENTARGERAYDIFSRLLKDRIIMVNGVIEDNMASLIVAQLLYLAAEDSKREINMYINSPGGSVSAGMGIYDAMRVLPCPVATTCVGFAASFGATLLMAGSKGMRYSMPRSRILIHQVLLQGGMSGQTTDIDIFAREMVRQRNEMDEIIAFHTGQPIEKVKRDTDRDFWMTPQEAKEYGIIDEILPYAEK